MSWRRAVVLLSKPSLPGRVKTRLIGEFSPEGAADLHRAFIADLSATLLEFERDRPENRCFAAWALATSTESLPQSALPSFAQSGGDLGQRLHHALTHAMAHSGTHAQHKADAVVAIGSDCPTLSLARLDQAFDALERGAGLVLGPASDGGYYLVGVRRASCVARLFEAIDWSTERVLAQTLERARELGLGVALLDEDSDVDTPADLGRLRARLARLPSVICTETRSALVALETRQVPG